jgi:chromate transporter
MKSSPSIADDIDPLAPATAQDPRSLKDLFLAFVRIGLTSFGGSTQAWVYRSIVEQQKWLNDKDYLAGLAISQILPGANPVNISLYVGQRLRGGIGALVAALGMLLPALCVILIMAAVYASLSRFPLTHFILVGVATAGVGSTIAAGIKITKKMERRLARYVFGIMTFLGVGVLHWPMLAVVGVLAPFSVIVAYMDTKNG